MFANLKTEMDKHGITKDDIARAVGKESLWLEKALQEKISLPVDAAVIIKETFFPAVSYEYLFEQKND